MTNDDTTDDDTTDGETTDGGVTDDGTTDDDVTVIDEVTVEASLPQVGSGRDRSRLLAFTVLPGLAMMLGALAGFLHWQDSSRRAAVVSAAESVAAARDTTAAILSYRPETVDKDLMAARDRLSGAFLESYTQLVNDVVIPGAKEKKITAVATVPAAGSVSADPRHAVVLVFVNQTTTIGNGAPSNSTSSVRVTLDKIRDRWLVSGFDPV